MPIRLRQVLAPPAGDCPCAICSMPVARSRTARRPPASIQPPSGPSPRRPGGWPSGHLFDAGRTESQARRRDPIPGAGAIGSWPDPAVLSPRPVARDPVRMTSKRSRAWSRRRPYRAARCRRTGPVAAIRCDWRRSILGPGAGGARTGRRGAGDRPDRCDPVRLASKRSRAWRRRRPYRGGEVPGNRPGRCEPVRMTSKHSRAWRRRRGSRCHPARQHDPVRGSQRLPFSTAVT